MLHLLTVTYEYDSFFRKGQRWRVTDTLLLNMDGVKSCLQATVYRKHNAIYHLAPYMGQAYKDHTAERIA